MFLQQLPSRSQMDEVRLSSILELLPRAPQQGDPGGDSGGYHAGAAGGGPLPGVDLHVCLQRALLLVGLRADGAAVGLLTCVAQHVSLQVHLLHKALGAQPAAEVPLLLVEPLVGLQRHLLAEGLAAEAADEGLLAGVNPAVGVQVAHLPEGLPTHLAGEGLLPSVDPAVDLQVLAHREALAAHLAGEAAAGGAALVATQVPPQDALVPECPPTELTDEGRRCWRSCSCLCCCCWRFYSLVVDLSVALQRAAAAKGPAAGGAGEGVFFFSFCSSSSPFCSTFSSSSLGLLIGRPVERLHPLPRFLLHLLLQDLLPLPSAGGSRLERLLQLQLLLVATRGSLETVWKSRKSHELMRKTDGSETPHWLQ